MPLRSRFDRRWVRVSRRLLAMSLSASTPLLPSFHCSSRTTLDLPRSLPEIRSPKCHLPPISNSFLTLSNSSLCRILGKPPIVLHLGRTVRSWRAGDISLGHEGFAGSCSLRLARNRPSSMPLLSLKAASQFVLHRSDEPRDITLACPARYDSQLICPQ